MTALPAPRQHMFRAPDGHLYPDHRTDAQRNRCSKRDWRPHPEDDRSYVWRNGRWEWDTEFDEPEGF